MEQYWHSIHIGITIIIGIIIYVFQRQKIKSLEIAISSLKDTISYSKSKDVASEYETYIDIMKKNHDTEIENKTNEISISIEKLIEMYFFALSIIYLSNYANRKEYLERRFRLCGNDLSNMIEGKDAEFMEYFKKINPNYNISEKEID